MISEYYAPHEIHYTWEQNIWLIKNVLGGGWPDDPRETGYVGSNHLPGQHAPFEMFIMITGELEFRLKRTGLAGRLLVTQLQANMTLDYDSKMALAYCCGNRRKLQKYSEWKRTVEYRRRSIISRKEVANGYK
ncbi:MAG: hypothetical protein WC639_04700 [Patescibacteria group bacterium]|jgi:hypothetical protein